MEWLSKNTREFFTNLKTGFNKIPPLNLVARQTRITPYSLHVLADIYIDLEEYRHKDSLMGDQEDINAMDLVYKTCHQAVKTVDAEYQGRFNVKTIPYPLHITLLRFPPGITSILRAEEWANTYKYKLWGKSEKLSIYLTKAKKFPYYDVEGVEIKKERLDS